MFRPDDTIVAIATPPGRGGIGVVRISGPAACDIASTILSLSQPLAPRHATFARVKTATADPESAVGTFLDHVIATYFQRPASYTGENVVEISAHGSPLVLRQIVNAAMEAGARLAQPGEFTLRAFLHERLDLVQAEAVADLIDAVTPLQARAAYDQLEGTLTQAIGEIDTTLFDLAARLEASVDFPEEGYHFVELDAAAAELVAIERRIAALLGDARRGRLIREGAIVALAGKPNVGKSSVFNALVGTGRAIVTTTPGTTRDLITELVDIHGLRITLVDTTGDRATTDQIDPVESAGVERGRTARQMADLVLVVLDRSCAMDDVDRAILEHTTGMRRLLIANKCDLPEAWPAHALNGSPAVTVSATTQAGLDRLRREIARLLTGDGEPLRDSAAVTNIRHIDLLQRARSAVCRAAQAVAASGGRLSEEFVLADLQDARQALEEITGKRTNDDLLEHIFSRFCIGK